MRNHYVSLIILLIFASICKLYSFPSLKSLVLIETNNGKKMGCFVKDGGKFYIVTPQTNMYGVSKIKLKTFTRKYVTAESVEASDKLNLIRMKVQIPEECSALEVGSGSDQQINFDSLTGTFKQVEGKFSHHNCPLVFSKDGKFVGAMLGIGYQVNPKGWYTGESNLTKRSNELNEYSSVKKWVPIPTIGKFGSSTKELMLTEINLSPYIEIVNQWSAQPFWQIEKTTATPKKLIRWIDKFNEKCEDVRYSRISAMRGGSGNSKNGISSKSRLNISSHKIKMRYEGEAQTLIYYARNREFMLKGSNNWYTSMTKQRVKKLEKFYLSVSLNMKKVLDSIMDKKNSVHSHPLPSSTNTYR